MLRFSTCGPIRKKADDLKEAIQRQHDTERDSLKAAAQRAAAAESLKALADIAAPLEKQTCQFADNRAPFNDLFEKLTDQAWQQRDRDYEAALDTLRKLSLNDQLTPVTVGHIKERIDQLEKQKEALASDWFNAEKEVAKLMETDWNAALALLRGKRRAYLPVPRIAVQLETRITALEKQISLADDANKAYAAQLAENKQNPEKQLEILQEASRSPKLSPDQLQRYADARKKLEADTTGLRTYYAAAMDACNQFDRDRAALPTALANIEKFRAIMKDQPAGSYAAWNSALDAKEKALRQEKAGDDALLAKARAALSSLKIEASKQCAPSFRDASAAIRGAVGTYDASGLKEMQADWTAKLNRCIEGTLRPANSRDGFKTAIELAACLEEFDPAQKSAAAKMAADLKKAWADFEWKRLFSETEHDMLNDQYPAALDEVKKYTSDGDPFEKRSNDAAKRKDQIITAWNDAAFARAKRLDTVVRDPAEFDNKMSQLDDKNLPPEELRAANLREIMVKKRDALTTSYAQMVYSSIAGRVRKLDQGIVQRWDELDDIETACKAYLEDRRIPAAAKSHAAAIKELRGKIEILREPTPVKVVNLSVWGAKKNLDGLYTFGGAYFAPVLLRNRDAFFTIAESRKGMETQLDKLLGWKDAYPLDRAADAARDINTPVWEDKFDIAKGLRVAAGDKLVVKLYSSKSPDKELDEKLLLLLREIDFGKYTPGFLVAHPIVRFEGAMQGENPELRKGNAPAGLVLTFSVQDDDRWKLILSASGG